jgi:hypothetical protein
MPKKQTGYRSNVIVSPQGKGFAWAVHVNGRRVAMSQKTFVRRRAAWRAWDRFAADVIADIGELDIVWPPDGAGPRMVPRMSSTTDRVQTARLRGATPWATP